MVNRLAAALGLGFLLFSASPALASIMDGAPKHDGFFLRFHTGPASLDISLKNSPTSIGGGGGIFSFALGGAVAENLILFGEMTNILVLDPTVTLDNKDFQTRNASAGVTAIGPGLSYYFMPINIYLSGTLLFARTRLEDEVSTASSEYGVGAKLALGKEWWVSTNWGLGLAGSATFAQMPDGADTVTSSSYGLMFSATYN